MLVYEHPDYQLWKQNEFGHIIDKVGNLPFKDTVLNLPNSSEPGLIEKLNSSEILSVEADTVVLKKKFIRNRKTSSKFTSNESDAQKWVVSPPDSQGFFKIIHNASKKVLTSSSESLKIEDSVDFKDLNDKKQLTKVRA